MQIKTLSFGIDTNGKSEIIDVTTKVQSLLNESQFKEGNALVFLPGATAGITTIEYEAGLLKDYPEFFDKIIPSDGTYHHNEAWHDGNGHSHVRAALQGASFTVPFLEGQLQLGTWQQIVVIDFDNRPRKRKVLVQLIGK